MGIQDCSLHTRVIIENSFSINKIFDQSGNHHTGALVQAMGGDVVVKNSYHVSQQEVGFYSVTQDTSFGLLKHSAVEASPHVSGSFFHGSLHKEKLGSISIGLCQYGADRAFCDDPSLGNANLSKVVDKNAYFKEHFSHSIWTLKEGYYPWLAGVVPDDIELLKIQNFPSSN